MGFLKKIRTNLLNQDNSFHIGFQNRNPIGGTSRKSSSPLNYRSQYSGDWTPTVQSLEQNPAGWIDPNMGGEWSKVTTAAIKAVGDIGTEVVISQLAPEKCTREGGIWVNGKCESGSNPPPPPSNSHKKSERLERRYDRVSDRSLRAYDKDTKRGDIRGDRRSDKAEDIAAKASRVKVQEDCVLKQGAYDPETNTCT